MKPSILAQVNRYDRSKICIYEKSIHRKLWSEERNVFFFFFYVKCHRRTIFGTQENLKIYAVKISALTHAINFSSLTVLKIFNAGARPGLATPLTTAAYVSFFLTKIVQKIFTTTSNRRLFRHALQLLLSTRCESRCESGNGTGDEELQ